MKTFISILVFALCTRYTNGQWQQTNGPVGVAVGRFANNGSTVFTGTSAGVFFTTNNGNTWMPANTGLQGYTPSSFVFCGSNIFASVAGIGVYISSNNGSTWNATSTTGLTDLDISDLAVIGFSIFAGTDGGVFRSDNNGSSWKIGRAHV